MILVRWLVVWVGVWWVGVAVARPVRAVGERPNVVILLADDLGIQDLGCFGRREHRTPHLDRLAAEGARFTQAYAAASVCSPSRAALLTGLSPARLRITTFLNGRSDRASHRLLGAPIERGLPAGATTLAEALRARGYRTAAVGKWHLGGAGSLPTDRGFAEYTPGRADPGPESPLGGKGELGQAAAAVDFIGRSKGQPFLLYVAFDNPHIPLAAPAGAVAAKAAGSPTVFHPAYAAMVESLDAACGRILKALDEAGVARAAIESLAENFSDGVVAPLFWTAVGGLPGGVLYKAANTADSMIGHRTKRHEAFGWAAARFDDLINLPASRLTALFLLVPASLTPGRSAREGWRALRRDAGLHRSPNAGWPEAAMAGALGLKLARSIILASTPRTSPRCRRRALLPFCHCLQNGARRSPHAVSRARPMASSKGRASCARAA